MTIRRSEKPDGRILALSVVAMVGLTLAGVAAWRHSSRLEEVSRDVEPRRAAETTTTAPAKSALKGEVLAHVHRQFLWETENVAFQITYKFAVVFGQAVAAADAATIEAFLAPSFRGQIFAADAKESLTHGAVRLEEQRKATHARVSADRKRFAEELAAMARRFRPKPQVQLAVVQLSPFDRTKLDGAWQGNVIVRMAGEQADGKPGTPAPASAASESFPSGYAVGDGKPLEITLKGVFRTDKLPINYSTDREWISGWDLEQVTAVGCDRPLFRDVTSASGIETRHLHDNWKIGDAGFNANPGGVYAGDFNRDGAIDLVVVDIVRTNLYLGKGDGTFTDATLDVGLPLDRPAMGFVAIADLDNDGDEDLIYGGMLLENRNGRFVQRGFIPLPREAVGAALADYDRDGLIDIYISCAAPLPKKAADDPTVGRVSWLDDESGMPNVLFQNKGNFAFDDVTAVANAAAGRRSSFSSVWLDADDDGWPDLYVVNELGSNILLHNQKNGTFVEKTIGPEFDGFAMGITAGDVDNDGRIDLYIGNMKSKVGMRIVNNLPPNVYPPDIIGKMKRWVSGNLLLANDGGLKFSEVVNGTEGNGWSYGPALVDLDGDGLLDVYSTCGFVSRSRREPDG